MCDGDTNGLLLGSTLTSAGYEVVLISAGGGAVLSMIMAVSAGDYKGLECGQSNRSVDSFMTTSIIGIKGHVSTHLQDLSTNFCRNERPCMSNDIAPNEETDA